MISHLNGNPHGPPSFLLPSVPVPTFSAVVSPIFCPLLAHSAAPVAVFTFPSFLSSFFWTPPLAAPSGEPCSQAEAEKSTLETAV